MAITFNKPHFVCWLAIPLLLLIGFLFSQHRLNVQLYDTYYVIANRQYAIAGSAILLIVGIGYWLLSLSGKTPNSILTGIHLFLTIGVLIQFAFPLFNNTTLAGAEWLFLCIVAFAAGQFAYATNILITLFRK